MRDMLAVATVAGWPFDLPVAAGLATVAGIAALALAWLLAGRDPPRGVVFPRFDPPGGLCPAAVRFLDRQACDDGCLNAALLSLAVKRAIRIERLHGGTKWGVSGYMLTPLGAPDSPLSRPERAVHDALFPGGRRLDLAPDPTTALYLSHARDRLQRRLRLDHRGDLRDNRTAYVAALAAACAAAIGLVGLGPTGSGIAVWLWIGAALAAGRALWVALRWRAVWPGKLALGLYAGELIVTVGVLGLGLYATSAAAALARPDLLAVAAAGALFGIAATGFARIMPRPTRRGQRLRDGIAGFARYMKVAEQRRIDSLTPPRMTPERIEALLPMPSPWGWGRNGRRSSTMCWPCRDGSTGWNTARSICSRKT